MCSISRCTPLHGCARAGRVNVCKLLLSHGADVNAKADERHACSQIEGNRVYSWDGSLFQDQDRSNNCLPLHVFLWNISLISCSIRHQWTPLHVSAYHDHVEVCKQLILAKADVTARTGFHKIPLAMRTCYCSQLHCRGCGATDRRGMRVCNCSLLRCRDGNRTPLTMAIEERNHDVIEFLRRIGAPE